MNKRNIFFLTSSILSLILIVFTIFGVLKVQAKGEELNKNLSEIKSFTALGLENEELKKKYEEIEKNAQDFSFKSSPKKMNELVNESNNLKKDVQNTYATSLLLHQSMAKEALNTMNKTVKDNEFIKVENTDIYRGLLTEAETKSKSANLAELTVLEQDLKKGLALYENEVEESKKADLISSLRSTLPEAEKLESFLNTKTGQENIKNKVETFKTKINGFIELENVKNTSFEDLEKTSQNDILPILASAKSDVEKIKEEDTAARKKLVEAEKANWNGKTPPQSPLGPDVPKQILVNLTEQHIYLYDQGEIIKNGPITSGKEGFPTVTGTYAIYAKKQKEILRSPFPDIEYEIPVDYWIPFFEGYGFHDASWRKEYGGQDYKTAGSHGCLNTPYDLVKFLYEWSDIGTKVVIVP